MQALDGKVLAQQRGWRPTPCVRVVAVFALTLAYLLVPSVMARAGEPVTFSAPAQVVSAEASLPGLIDLPVAKAAAPVITSISPIQASAGTGTTVTITGNGFGTRSGEAKVYFIYKAPPVSKQTEYIPASNYLEWSDTRIICEVPVDDEGYVRSSASGPVTVIDSSGLESNSVDLSVSFGFWCRFAGPVREYVIATSNSGWRKMVAAAGDTWSSAGSEFRFRLLPQRPAHPSLRDGVSEVYWKKLTDEHGKPMTALAQTQRWPKNSTKPTEIDIVFNTRYPWGSHMKDKYDVQSVALHEMGHALGLRDLYGVADKGKVMYGQKPKIGSSGVVRTLSADNIAGVKWIYPGSAFPICTSAGLNWGPAISGNTVVWVDARDGDNHIYGYDLTAKREFPICTVAGNQGYPAISGDTVVWVDNRNDVWEGDIYGYDLTAKREFPICTAAGDQLDPAISGDTVVWTDERDGDTAIYGYDLARGSEFRIPTVAADHPSMPAISGDMVVFASLGEDFGGIYGYNLARRIEIPISTVGVAYEPAVSGNTVVYCAYRDRLDSSCIYGYDLTTNRESPISSRLGWKHEPAISGNTIIWQDHDAFDKYSVYGFDIGTGRGRIYPVSDAEYGQSSPAISGGTVVWLDRADDETSHIYGVTLGP